LHLERHRRAVERAELAVLEILVGRDRIADAVHLDGGMERGAGRGGVVLNRVELAGDGLGVGERRRREDESCGKKRLHGASEWNRFEFGPGLATVVPPPSGRKASKASRVAVANAPA